MRRNVHTIRVPFTSQFGMNSTQTALSDACGEQVETTMRTKLLDLNVSEAELQKVDGHEGQKH